MREFPAIVDIAPGLLEDTAVFLKLCASSGFGTVTRGAIAITEEEFEHGIVEGKDRAPLLEDVHVVIGHDHAFSDLVVGA